MALSGNFYLTFILALLAAEYLLGLLTDRLNLGRLSPDLPAEFRGFYDPQKYERSQAYLRETTAFDGCSSTFTLLFSFAFILAGGFNAIDLFARSFGLGPILTGLLFSFMLKFLMDLLGLPFEIYDTFVIEQKYGFNKTTARTFLLDFLKEWGLTIAIGAPALAAVLWIFGALGSRAWLWVWAFVTALQLFMAFISPVLLLPLFNKFTPLPDGPLKDEITAYTERENFKTSGIFVMDGSRRTSKTNAFFTGLGRFKRIVLFDTLIEKHTPQELTAVLAHEMGHLRNGHLLIFTVLAVLQTGFMLWLMSFFIGNRGLFDAFRMEHVSFYASLVFFGFLYTPISFFLGIFMNWLSRKFEFEADAYAGYSYGNIPAFISALKILAVDNLSDLTPHPLKVFLEYSHPPVLDRLDFLRKMGGT